MKEISSLVTDIYHLIQHEKGWFDDTVAHHLSQGISSRLREQLGKDTKRSGLRLSQMGDQCPRKVWYSIRHPEMAEPYKPWEEIKFSFGHVLEALALTLAKAAGHTVEGEQDALELDGIVGHRDAIIDGVTVDIKSSSSRGFLKFRSRNFEEDDDFGYLDQLDGYVLAAHSDPLVVVKDKGYILAIEKQLGHMALYEHTITAEREQTLRKRIEDYKRIVALPEPPPCSCGTRTDGASGNIKLDIKASYSAYKHLCFPHLRTFLYSGGPNQSARIVHLSKVVRTPDVREIDRFGRTVYN